MVHVLWKKADPKEVKAVRSRLKWAAYFPHGHMVLLRPGL